jgi:predicted dehydrogenase
MQVLFTGLGSIGHRHLRLLRERNNEFDIHAYRSGESDYESPNDVTEHKTLESALNAAPDVAFITNPTYLHVETALQCAKADCDLFIEKPISNSLDGLDTLQEIASKNELITYIGCNLRFNPVLMKVKEWLDIDRIGNILTFRANVGSYLPDWRPDQDYRESYSASRQMGGGVVLDLIHEYDYVYWLLGDISDITGRADQVSSLEISSEDLSETVLTLEQGAVGSIHLDYFRRVPNRTFEIVGESGIIEADLIQKTATVETPEKKETEKFDYERDDVYRDQLDYFLSSVRNREQCHNDVTEATKVLEVALEARGTQNE